MIASELEVNHAEHGVLEVALALVVVRFLARDVRAPRLLHHHLHETELLHSRVVGADCAPAPARRAGVRGGGVGLDAVRVGTEVAREMVFGDAL